MHLHKKSSDALNHKSHGVVEISGLSTRTPEFKSYPFHFMCAFEKLLAVSEPVSVNMANLISQG